MANSCSWIVPTTIFAHRCRRELNRPNPIWRRTTLYSMGLVLFCAAETTDALKATDMRNCRMSKKQCRYQREEMCRTLLARSFQISVSWNLVGSLVPATPSDNLSIYHVSPDHITGRVSPTKLQTAQSRLQSQQPRALDAHGERGTKKTEHEAKRKNARGMDTFHS